MPGSFAHLGGFNPPPPDPPPSFRTLPLSTLVSRLRQPSYIHPTIQWKTGAYGSVGVGTLVVILAALYVCVKCKHRICSAIFGGGDGCRSDAAEQYEPMSANAEGATTACAGSKPVPSSRPCGDNQASQLVSRATRNSDAVQHLYPMLDLATIQPGDPGAPSRAADISSVGCPLMMVWII